MLIILLILLLLLIAMRIPIAYVLLALAALYFTVEGELSSTLIQRMSTSMESFPLLAIPLFILAGTIMARGGIASRLLRFAELLVGRFTGGLAQVNVLNSVMMGGMSGSANADAAVDAKILVPIMRRNGYSNGFASALSVASGAIAPILPPSIGLIVYGTLADVSISALFIGGIVPALLIAVALMTTVRIMAGKRGYRPTREAWPSAREVATGARDATWALLMPILLIVGLRSGVFTPTELAAILAVYALVVSLVVYKEISWKDLPAVFDEATRNSAVIMLIISGAAAFGIVVAYEQVTEGIASFLGGFDVPAVIILIAINVMLLALGTVMESLSLTVLLVPILAPLAVGLGVDPVHFGVMMVINFTIGSMTPPVGTVIYTVISITKSSVGEFTREFVPFLAALIAVLLIVTFVPATVTFLPGLGN